MTPMDSAATVAHDLRWAQGGQRMERFIYAWCPCGWIKHLDAIGPLSAYATDDGKRAFAAHLEAASRA